MAKPHDGGGGGGGDRLSINQSNSPLAAAVHIRASFSPYILKKVHVVVVAVVLALHLCCGVDRTALRSSMRLHYPKRPDSL